VIPSQGGKGRDMLEVTRKPFRIKEIRRLPHADTSIELRPAIDQPVTSPEPVVNQYATAKKERYYNGMMSRIILEIIQEGSGLNAVEVTVELRKYFKRKKFYNPPDLSIASSASGMLYYLVKKEVLTRIKINDVYHYYLRV
jgi:hypothetical protein